MKEERYFQKNRALLIVLVIVNVIFYSVCYFSLKMSAKQTVEKTVSGLSFNSITDKPRRISEKLPVFYKTFSVEFESDFRPLDDNYTNIFQTANDPKTLRVELIRPRTMQVVIGSNDLGLKVYKVSGKVKMNAWNHIKLIYSSNKNLYIKLNDEPSVSFDDNRHDVAVSDLVLGAGFDRQRVFVGSIKNAKFSLIFNDTNILFYILGTLSKYYLVFVFFQLLFLYTKYLSEHNIEIKEHNRNDVLTGFLITFSIVAFIVLLTGMLSSPLTEQRKWIPFLALLIPSVALSMKYLKIELFNKKYFSVIAGLFSFAILVLGVLNYDRLSWFGISGLLIICCCLSITPFLKSFTSIFIGTFIFLFGINSVVFVNSSGAQGYIWTTVVMVVVICAFLLSLTVQNHPERYARANKIGFAFLLIISAILALRSDSLFLGSSEYHWSYFTGVIQAIRSGGELLWSSPSQYGLLNVLLPSLLPWTSRNSFYIFQAGLLFVITFIIIRTIYMSFKHSVAFTLIALTSLSLFYFADPAVIGPGLYPSSSVMRFFWVYILIYTILLEYYRHNILNRGIKWVVTGVYIFGALWSAESMLYSTAIYATYLLACAIIISKSKKNSAFKFVYKNISVIFLTLIVINIFYLAITGHFPDWDMYFMYAFNYAQGYGELAIKPWGIHWAVIIALSGIVFILSRLYSAKKYNEWIVCSVCFVSLWALTSYYVGRAVTNNLTAILPIIFYIFIVISSVLMDSKLLAFRLLLNAVFLPWIIVGVIGGIGNPQFIEKLKKFKYAEDINSKSFKPDRELDSILKSLEATKGTRIVYYGEPYNNPVLQGKNGRYMDTVAGMPIPLVLLEEPIPEEKREIIIERFLSSINGPVFLIHRENENMERFLGWKKLLERKFFMEKKNIGSGKYEVFLVKKS